MAIQTNKTNKISRLFWISLLFFLLVAFGPVACKSGEEVESGEEAAGVQEGIMHFEGTVKMVVGKYVFLPEASGFDVVIQGNLDSGPLEDLVGKQVRGEGNISPDMPSILVANTLEVAGDTGDWTSIFTRTQEPLLEDYLDLNAREAYVALPDLSYDKKDVWEQNVMAKVYGRLEKNDAGDKIAVFDDEGAEIGKVLVDSYTDFCQFYLGKLGHFDKFWFYLKVKDTVEWSQRRRSREMFHADVVFAGLF
jgi:hypothetical protein